MPVDSDSEFIALLERIHSALAAVKENLQDRPLTDHKHKIWYAVASAERALMTYRLEKLDDVMMESTEDLEGTDRKSPRSVNSFLKLLDESLQLVTSALRSPAEVNLEKLWDLKSAVNALLRATFPKRTKLSKSFPYPFP